MVRSACSFLFGTCSGYIFVASLLHGEYDLMVAVLLIFGSFLMYTIAVHRRI